MWSIRRTRRPAPGARPRGESGQILVIFAGGLILIIAVAALVFDTGQSLVDRRTQQNAADAAALAGARYLPTVSGTYQGLCDDRSPSQKVDNNLKHVSAACDVAEAYVAADNLGDAVVTVKYPPGPESNFSGQTQYIQVTIDSTRPSIFSGLLGLASHHTGALAVARNSSNNALPFSLLSLDPCGTSSITGNGVVEVGGAIHVDSECSPGLMINGNGGGQASSCDAVAGVVDQHNNFNCPEPTPVQVSGDPLVGLATPPEPTTLGRVVRVAGTGNVPNSCPVAGSDFATFKANPQTCRFSGGSVGSSTYRLYPGYYPGGISVQTGTTLYLEPGIYWIGGGGFSMTQGTVIAVDAGGTTLATADGGVLLYNSEDVLFHDQCAADPIFNVGCYGALNFNGTTVSVQLRGIQTTLWKNMVIFQDR
ncbi:MAG TPA: pilus assembly protein TadG-related protein, partial [Candidatus Limnocylindrales bacterium]|nr:pilus assembly protein TadG-related protein [Candidatus Limnocylindrales bacterium]